MGPDKDTRARNVASDPYGAAKFFHFTVNALLETLLQVKVTKYQVRSDTGIFGKVSAYFGTVEAQGRGTLHLHMLIWLKNAPTSDELMELLKSDVFRAKMCAFIKANVRAYCPGLESAESVKKIPSDQGVGFNRPLHPDSPTFTEDMNTRELGLARTLQVHTCKIRRCLVFDKHGKLVCKRKAPWSTSNQDFVDETGHWGPKRLYPYVNGWNPSVLLYAGCNNDCKILTNGRDTKNLSYYVTSYAAKKQGRGFNMSAILAEGYAYHVQHPRADYVDSLRDIQRLLIFRLVHSINREQELSGPMVISYLMSWGDVYRSHQYTAVYWSSFVSALSKAFPDIYARPATEHGQHDNAVVANLNDLNVTDADEPISHAEPRGTQVSESAGADNAGGDGVTVVADSEADNPSVRSNLGDEDIITLEINGAGRLYAKSQVTDYLYRGRDLEELNVYELFADTYEAAIPQREPAPQMTPVPSDSASDDEPQHPHVRGRRSHVRSKYVHGHPHASKKHRVVRSPLHRNIINFVGRYFPSRDDPTTYPFYCASMLVLLKPWRVMEADLKGPDQTWSEAFAEFRQTASPRVIRTLSGIQYYHDCRSAATAEEHNGAAPMDDSEGNFGGNDEIDPADNGVTSETVVSEAAIARALAQQTSPSELLHAKYAIEVAKGAKIFPAGECLWTPTNNDISNATGGDFAQLVGWQTQMQADVARLNGLVPPVSTPAPGREDPGVVARVEDTHDLGGPSVRPAPTDDTGGF
ncbi:hypothetical protein EW026_g7232 [Hermanssonia centrifuga]|uniref:Helitron helicase-like domain-containing protein n=1 Tax=Hermanssonia centrifuga TaxID=98765 RepID=A0A4S4K9J9_9APHY|nr:hypothetical protein EW026_g7232 [Hermanssonia centrifuga]